MASKNTPEEYSDIVRLYRPVHTPIGYVFVKANASPYILDICRQHTLGRGRILYEVSEVNKPAVIGYIVLEDIFQLACRHSTGVSLDIWRTYDDHQHDAIRYAHWILKKRFPRLPEIAAKEIPEKACTRRWRCDRNELEDMVVQYALHQWTSYDFRFEPFVDRLPVVAGKYIKPLDDAADVVIKHDKHIGRKHEEIFEVVKPRLRQVLRSWLPRDFGIRELSTFYRRHKLCADEAEMLLPRCASHGMGGDVTLLNYGGGETIANITARVDLITSVGR